jgi:hypothetical protein
MDRPVEAIKLVYCWNASPDRIASQQLADRIGDLQKERWMLRWGHFEATEAFVLMEHPTVFRHLEENSK